MDTNNYNNFEEWKNQKMDELTASTNKQIEDLKKENKPYHHLIMLLNENLKNIMNLETWFELNKHLL